MYNTKMVKYKTIKQFSKESGYSEDAIRSKVKRGDWQEGDIWYKAPDGRVLISIEGYNSWVTGAEKISEGLATSLPKVPSPRLSPLIQA